LKPQQAVNGFGKKHMVIMNEVCHILRLFSSEHCSTKQNQIHDFHQQTCADYNIQPIINYSINYYWWQSTAVYNIKLAQNLTNDDDLSGWSQPACGVQL